jgi:hypothetical protein
MFVDVAKQLTPLKLWFFYLTQLFCVKSDKSLLLLDNENKTFKLEGVMLVLFSLHGPFSEAAARTGICHPNNW